MHNEVRGQLERYSSPSAIARALAQAALPTEWPRSPFSLQRLVPEAHLGLFMLLFKIEYLDLTCVKSVKTGILKSKGLFQLHSNIC